MLTLPILAIVAVAAVAWLLYRYATAQEAPKGLKPLPGPKGYPLIGSVLDFPKAFGYHKFKDWSDAYGPLYKVNILGTTHVVISDVDVANDLLALRGAQHSDRPPIIMLHQLVSEHGNLGTSPLNKYWRNARKLAAAQMNSMTLEAWNTFQVAEAARLVCDLARTPERYEYLFERYSAIVTLRILYGKEISPTDEAAHVDRITTIVRTLERTSAPGAYLVDFLPVLRHLPDCLAPFKAEARKLHDYEYSYFRGLVADANQTYCGGRGHGPRALVHAYLDNKTSYDLTDFELTYCMGTLFEGGSGTTSAAMQAFCLAMWHFPEWQAKVQQEIDDVVGDRIPTFEDWPSLPTVRAAMKETLRWRPIVPGGIPHFSSRDDNYKGFFIPKGAILHANQYAMFQDEAVYPDAQNYNPDRWLNPKYPTYQEPLSQYPNLKRFASFGFGRRICPGLVSAERSLFIEITTLMWACSVDKKLDTAGNVIPVPWYDFKPGNNTGPKHFDFSLTVREGQRIQMLQASLA